MVNEPPCQEKFSIIPGQFFVGVIMERQRVLHNRWISERWQVLGVVATAKPSEAGIQCRPIHQDEQGEQYLWSGFKLQLFRDEAESYYYNLLGRQPSLFVICRQGEDNRVTPFLTLLSHYETEAYLEAGDLVFAVPMPPEVYRWLERFVVEHYVPEPKKGRKRERWDGRQDHI